MTTGLLVAAVLGGVPAGLQAAPRSIHVFVALCDNESQGIAPVPARIGDGDVPDANLYWGCSDGLATFFVKSPRWKLTGTERNLSEDLLVRLQFRHTSADLTLTADAYRGTAIASCLREFERAIAAGRSDLVAYLGHNGLMDFALPSPGAGGGRKPAVVVLCCKSADYFARRVREAGGNPLLLTDQFMYPGSFILHDAVEAWRQGKSRAEIRAAAGRAYARNQKIPVRAATGVFAKLDD